MIDATMIATRMASHQLLGVCYRSHRFPIGSSLTYMWRRTGAIHLFEMWRKVICTVIDTQARPWDEHRHQGLAQGLYGTFINGCHESIS